MANSLMTHAVASQRICDILELVEDMTGEYMDLDELWEWAEDNLGEP